jgi:hypothetical protein
MSTMSDSSVRNVTERAAPAEPRNSSSPDSPTRTPWNSEMLGGRSRGVSPFLAAASVNDARPAVDVPQNASCLPDSSETTVARTLPWSDSNATDSPR